MVSFCFIFNALYAAIRANDKDFLKNRNKFCKIILTYGYNLCIMINENFCSERFVLFAGGGIKNG